MADTDKARKKRKGSVASDEAKMAANGEDEVRANLRGLVMSAGNALGILDDVPAAIEAAPLKEEAPTSTEVTEASDASEATEASSATEADKAAEDRALKTVEWTAQSRDLEFSEAMPENEERPLEEPEIVGAEIGDLEPESGEIEAADGDVEPETGDFAAADGDVEPSTGDVEAASEEVEVEIVMEPETGEPVEAEFASVADATEEENEGPLGALAKRLVETNEKKSKGQKKSQKQNQKQKKKAEQDELDASSNTEATIDGNLENLSIIDEESGVMADAEAEMAAAERTMADAEVEMIEADGETEVSALEVITEAEGATEYDARSGEQGDLFGDAEEVTEGEDVEADDSLEASDELSAEPTEFITEDQLMSVIESLLFSTDKPVSVATVKQIFKGSNIRNKDITRALDMLASEYASASRGVTLEEVHGGYQLRTKSDNMEYLRRLVKARPFRLSGPALEVMAIVAYKQPITKHEIDEIRGVESGHLLRALMERSLVCFGPKSELPGKPMTYNSTRKFLEIFGLRNIKELPTLSEIDELLPEGIGEVEEKETLSDITDQMAQEIVSSYSEGEEELAKINQQLLSVDTSTEFFEQEKQRERDRKDRERAQDIRERIVLGDAVEEKDRRWLDRYEAKLAAPPVVATEGEAVAATDGMSAQDGEGMTAEAAQGESAEGAEADVQIAGALEALSDEAQAAASRKSDADADEEELNQMESAFLEDVGDEPEDMTANPDWDEDSESDKGH